MGEVNKGVVALIIVMLLGASGYLWHLKLYKPAVAARATAVASEQAAQATLTAAEQKLATATEAAKAAKDEASKPDDSVHRLAKARTAVPEQSLLDDAAIVLIEMAQRSGVQTSFKAGSDPASGSVDPSAGGALQGAVPVDLEFKAAGTYAEMMQFMSLVEGNVEAKDDKLFTRGRLFNVVKLEIGSDDEAQGVGADEGFAPDPTASAGDQEFNLGPNDLVFKVVVRMYTSSTENSMGVGTTTDPATGATDPAAVGTDPAGADGAAMSDPAAAGAGAPATADPSAAGAATPDPAGAPTGAATGTSTGGSI